MSEALAARLSTFRVLRDAKVAELFGLTYDGTDAGLDELTQKHGALCNDIIAIDANIRGIEDAIAGQIRHYFQQQESERRKLEADEREARIARANEKRAQTILAKRQAKGIADERRSREVAKSESSRFVRWPDLGSTDVSCFQLPVPVVNINDRSSAQDHVFTDEAERRARSTMQWAPWSRRARYSSRRRYEGFYSGSGR